MLFYTIVVKKIDLDVLKLLLFRKNMGLNVSEAVLKEYFCNPTLDRSLRKMIKVDIQNVVRIKKLKYARENVQLFYIFNWVRFIAVTGSVAAGTVIDDDDIDVFVVVKNGRLWLYRGLLLIKNFFNKKIRFKEGSNVKDLFCVNLIVEERGMVFDSNIFNLHELLYMQPIYNSQYKKDILSRNLWIKEYGVKVGRISNRESFPFLIPVDLLAFIGQIIFMIIRGHDPDLKEIIKNYLEGKIAFHPRWFRDEKLLDFTREYNRFLRSHLD